MTPIFNRSNLKKTYYYLKKNGWKSAWYAARERIAGEKNNNYCYYYPEEAQLMRQRKAAEGLPQELFSILVPAYETKPAHLKAMIDSVLNQTWPLFELIIADAGLTDTVERTVKGYADGRIRYLRLPENRGISENTNRALKAAHGSYVGLLDHDDLLTPDALYRMAEAVGRCAEKGVVPLLLYSDEDKGDEECTAFCEPNRKPDFNWDLLLSNNYICHFLVMKRELMQKLKLRSAYDGAQDYDLILRAAWELKGERETIVHIPSVLYHWRCHSGSTAENPQSKRYAYEAGRRAVEDMVRNAGWKAKTEHLKHLGFYRVEYTADIFTQRPEVGVTGGKLLDRHGKITGGMYDADGNVMYAGLYGEYSGYMHRASLAQEAYAVDVRRMKVRKELWGLFEEVLGVPYRASGDDGFFDWKGLAGDRPAAVFRKWSLDFCAAVWEAGYTVVWRPEDAARLESRQKT